jgi:hypothetical protein
VPQNANRKPRNVAQSTEGHFHIVPDLIAQLNRDLAHIKPTLERAALLHQQSRAVTSLTTLNLEDTGLRLRD